MKQQQNAVGRVLSFTREILGACLKDGMFVGVIAVTSGQTGNTKRGGRNARIPE